MVEPRHRLPALDGIRGVAALAVLAFHCGLYLDMPWLFGHGALAVDVFFVMSGFVVARAYGARLAAGWSAASFASVRLARLYPLYLLGTLLGLGIILSGCHWSDPAGTLQVLAVFTVSGLLLVPFLAPGMHQVFPLNGPSWSLAIEAVLNAAFVLFARRWSTRQLGAVVALAALVLTAAAASGIMPLLGGLPGTLWLDLLRGIFGFGTGMLVERLHARGVLGDPRAGAALPVLAAVCALLLVPRSTQDIWFDPLAILLLCPALVIAALSIAPTPRMARLCEQAGAISYPLYILHAPILELTARRAVQGTSLISPGADTAAAALACLILAWAVARWVEPGLGRAMRRWEPHEQRAAPPLAPTQAGSAAQAP